MLEDADIRTRWMNAQVTQLMQQNCNLKPRLLNIDVLSGLWICTNNVKEYKYWARRRFCQGHRFKEPEAIVYLLENIVPIQIDPNEAIHRETKELIDEHKDGEQKETGAGGRGGHRVGKIERVSMQAISKVS